MDSLPPSGPLNWTPPRTPILFTNSPTQLPPEHDLSVRGLLPQPYLPRDLGAERGALSPVHVAMVSTYTPRQCGIATFTSDLAAAIRDVDPGVRIHWAAIDEAGSDHTYGSEVRWQIQQGDPQTYRRAAAALNQADIDVVSIQHEFGLYGGWGETFDDHLRPFLETLDKPLVTTFHTVLPDPSPSVLAAVQRVGDRSQGIVVMAERAKHILEQQYGLDRARLHVVPHGVPPITSFDRRAMQKRLGLEGRSVISTFGLVDPRKGLEYMIEAMVDVVRRHPDALYLVLGKTHPELVRRAGEQYRGSLVDLVHSRGLEGHVAFVDEYLSQTEILDYLVASDIYVTPYLDPNQITSGTLSYALGAGKAIISTRYAHATEALADERGILVDFRNADQLADAVTDVLGSPVLKDILERNAQQYGSQMAWPNVGANISRLYRAVAEPFADVSPELDGRSLLIA